jgi:hypothetical protein
MILIFKASHLMKRQAYLKRYEAKGYPATSPRIAGHKGADFAPEFLYDKLKLLA